MKQNTIWVLSFTAVIMIVCIAFGAGMKPTNSTLIIVGIAIFLFGLALSIPDIIRAIKQKQYEKDVLTRKVPPKVSKSYVPNRAKTAEEIAAEKEQNEDKQ